MRWALLWVIAAGCGLRVQDGDMLAIGDSYLAWNEGEEASIPYVIGEALDRRMLNRAISGTQLHAGVFQIPDRYVSGPWSWVVMTGGGNDFNDACGCGECDTLMDDLLSEDGAEGLVADFSDEVALDSAGLVYVGYGELPEDAQFGFDRCPDVLDSWAARLQSFAESRDSVLFVDGRAAIYASDLSLYDEDHVHPSIAGSAALGELVAAAITAEESG